MSQCGYVHLKISPSRTNEQPGHHLKFCPLKGFPFITILHSPWREGLLRVPQGGDQCCSDLLSGGTSILHRLTVNFSSSINKSQRSYHMTLSGFREKRQCSRRNHASLNLSFCFTFIFRPCWSQISYIKHRLDDRVLLCTLSFLTWWLRHLPVLEGQIRFNGYLVAFRCSVY